MGKLFIAATETQFSSTTLNFLSNKLQSIGNGTAASDAAAYGQLATVATSANASHYPLFVSSVTDSSQTFRLDADYTYNPSTNTLTATTFSGALSGNATTATLAATATLASTVTVADAAGDTTTFPMLAGSATGSLPVLTDPGLSYNATTNELTTTTFIGNLTGTASSSTTSTNVATTSKSDNVSYFLTFVSANSTSSQNIDVGPISYNPSTNTLTATTFVGALTGNASTATLAATVTTNANLTGDVTSVGNTTTYSGTLGINKGGTGQTTANAGFNALSPMTTLGDVIYGDTSGVGTRLAGNFTTSVKFLTQVGDGVNSAAPSWQTIPTAGVLTFMFKNTASDIATYINMPSISSFVPGVLATTTVSVTTSATLMDVFATVVGFPNITNIPVGVFTAYYKTQKASGGEGYFTFYTVYKRTSGGVETLITTSENSSTLTLNTVIDQQVDAFITSAVTLLSTDRIVIKIYCQKTSGGGTNIGFQFDDTTLARLEMPSATVDATNFVPYTGATLNVDLGSKTLTTTGAITGNTLVSTVATGTAPLTVSSTTQVANLNAATAGLASTVVVADAASDTTTFPMLAGDATGNLAVLTDSGLTYNSSTNNLSTTTFTGALTGTASGNTTYSANNHGVVLSSATNAMIVVAPNASTAFPLISGGASADPTWAKLSEAGGGTNQTSYTTGDLLYASATNTLGKLALGTSNQVLQTSDATNVAWATINQYNAKNYINANPDAEVNTTGYATFADAAANIPVDMTGGSATNLTFSRSTSSPLRGSGQFSMVQANSTSLQGKGVSYDFTIDAADKAQVLAINFDFNASSTFVAGNGITAPLNDGTVTTNAGNSDIEIFIYDVTNAVLIPVSPQTITANGANNFTYKATFQTASNSTSYRIGWYVATASANATGWTFLFDNVFVGRQSVAYGAAITDWAAYTPVFTGFGTATAIEFQYRRFGDSLQIRGKFTLGTSTGVEARISLPTGLTSSDTTKIVSIQICGQGTKSNNTTTQYLSLIEASVTYITVGLSSAGTAGLTKSIGSDVGTTGQLFTIQAQVPIQGWSSTVLMSNDTDTRVVGASYFASANGTTSTTQTINFDTLVYDTHGAVTKAAPGTGVWKFTAPVSGLYNIGGNFATTASGTYFAVYKNGVIYAYTAYDGTTAGTPPNYDINLVAGDFIDIRANGSKTYIGGTQATTAISSIIIKRITGPAAIAATDTVNCRYYASSTVITSSLATVVWTTKDYDSHNAMSSGVYTVPIAGKYQVSSNVGMTGTIALNSLVVIEIQKNSSVYTRNKLYSGGVETQLTGLIDDTINCLAGDTIRIQLSNTCTSPVIVTSNFENFISITRTGN